MKGRFTAEETKLIRDLFKGNDKLLKLIRKILLPEITPDSLQIVPVNQLIDVYGSISPDRDPLAVVTDVKARNLLIAHLNVQLGNLEVIANTPEETEESIKDKEKKNSTQ